MPGRSPCKEGGQHENLINRSVLYGQSNSPSPSDFIPAQTGTAVLLRQRKVRKLKVSRNGMREGTLKWLSG